MSGTSGVNSSNPTTAQLVGGVYNALAPTLNDGQAAGFQFDVNGNLKTTSSGGGGGGNVNITGINGTAPGLTNPLPVELSDGSAALGTNSNPLRISPASGAATQNVSLAAETTKVIGTVRVLGNAGAILDGATAAAVPANAVQQGARAATAYPTAVTDGQLVAPMADKAGRQVTVPNVPRDLTGTASVNASAASGTSLVAAGATGVFNDIISLVITNETSTATIVSLTDGTTTYKFALAANGGIVLNFSTPLPAASSATAWTCGNSATVALDYVVIYAKNK